MNMSTDHHGNGNNGASSPDFRSPCSTKSSTLNEEIRRHCHYITPKLGYITEYEDQYRDPAAYPHAKEMQALERKFKGCVKMTGLTSPVLPGMGFRIVTPTYKDAQTEISAFDSKFLEPVTGENKS